MNKTGIALILAAVMLLSLLSCTTQEQATPKATNTPTVATTAAPTQEPTAETAPNDEVALAIDYGFVPQGLQGSYDEVVLQSEYCEMLENVLYLYDQASVPAWRAVAANALSSSRKMKREDAMLAIYEAACVLGLGENTNGDWAATDVSLEAGAHFWELSQQFLDWPNAGEPCPFCTNVDTYRGGAYHYAQGQYSPISGKRVFDYDEENADLNMLDKLTRTAAIETALRFYESIAATQILQGATEQEREALASLVAARKDAIQNSASMYPINGTVYYVSNNGDDSNDGLTPETAWQTLDKVNSGAWVWEGQLNNEQFPEFYWASEHPNERVSLHSGDTVLFERGGLWRGLLQTVEGVTYSAYGEGEKPRFYGSPENGAGAEKWSLVEGTTNIWLYHRPLQQCGIIVCDAETTALRDYAFYDDGAYYKMRTNLSLPFKEAMQLPKLTPQTITEDLHFFCEIPAVDAGEFCWMAGALYLRCDEGNPGEVFTSMEFATGNNGWNEGMARVHSNVTLDNLCFRYGMSGIMVHDSENAVIRSCEVSYVGGMIISAGGGSDISDRPEEFTLTCSGDAILLGGINNVAENNYISNTFDYGVTVEAFSGDPDSPYRSGCRVSNNLLENCCGGLLITDWNAVINRITAPVFTDITLSKNIVAYCGCTKWAHHDQRFDEDGNFIGDGYCCSELGLWINPGCRDIVVQDNVFGFGYENEYQVAITYIDSDKSWLTANGNTFLADYGAKLISVNNYGINGNEDQYLRYDADNDPGTAIAEQLNDANCKLSLME